MSDQLTHHLSYELWMLEQTLRRLAAGQSDTVITNALIESFCIHARAIIEFLQDPAGDKARLYVLPGQYRPFSSEPKAVNTYKTRLNKQIAHLDKDGRHIVDSGKIDGAERMAIYELLRSEYPRFLACLRPEFASKAPKAPSALSISVLPSSPGATNQIATVSSAAGGTRAGLTDFSIDTNKPST